MTAGRVVIAGGTGLVGRALAGSIAADGREVVVLTRQEPSLTRLPAGCRAVRWDGRSNAGWIEEAKGAAALVNLAGESIAGLRWTRAKRRRILDSRLRSVAAMGEALAALAERSREPLPALVQASAIGYYGDRRDEELDEESTPGSGFLAETCVEWERASEAVERLGVRRAIARTGLVLAKDGGFLEPMRPLYRLGLGARIGDGRPWIPWIHLADEVAALKLLIDDPRASGPFNLTAPAPARQRDLHRALARALRRPAFLVVPAFALRLALGEMSSLVLASDRALPRRLAGLGFRHRFDELDAALADLFG